MSSESRPNLRLLPQLEVQEVPLPIYGSEEEALRAQEIREEQAFGGFQDPKLNQILLGAFNKLEKPHAASVMWARQMKRTIDEISNDFGLSREEVEDLIIYGTEELDQ